MSAGARPLTDDDVQFEIFHRWIEDFFHGGWPAFSEISVSAVCMEARPFLFVSNSWSGYRGFSRE